MNAKKWVLSLPVIVLILAALLAGFNYVTDRPVYAVVFV